MATRLHDRYVNEAVPALKQKFGYKNPMEVPKLVKVIINMGLGRSPARSRRSPRRRSPSRTSRSAKARTSAPR